MGIETPKKERPARTTLRPGEDTKQCSLTGAGIDLEQRTLTAEH